jgi:hypothetical protein
MRLARSCVDNVPRAYDYLFAPWALARAARRATASRAEGKGLRFNRLTHRRALSDHTHRVVTAPNSDTLYSSAFLDLAGGPVTLSAPDAGARYFSIALMKFFHGQFFLHRHARHQRQGWAVRHRGSGLARAGA